MKVRIVYDSMFGNTEKIAQAMAETLRAEGLDAQAVKVTEATPQTLAGVELLLVGSPTQAFSPLKPVKSFLRGLAPGSLKGVQVAGFDTRARVEQVNSKLLTFMVGIFGYAAEPIAAGLRKKGGQPAAPPAGFFVEGKEGPLEEGELQRAAEWARAAWKGALSAD